MHKMNGDRSLANRRSHTFYVARANVADRKHSGKAGFEHLRYACQRPRDGRNYARRSIEVAPGDNETLVVHRDAARQPLSPWRRAGHDEDTANVVGRSLPSRFIQPGHALELTVAIQANDLSLVVE